MKILFAFYIITCTPTGINCFADNLTSFETRENCELFQNHFITHYAARNGVKIVRTACERVESK